MQQFGCKVCDTGVLIPRKIYRMSGPVVAIGYILLIPSILGMIASALIFFGLTALGVHGLRNAPNQVTEPVHEDWNTRYRRACINIPESDTAVPITQRVPYCECTRSEYKRSNSTEHADQICSQKLQANALDEVSEDTKRAYDNLIGTSWSDVGEIERVQSQPQTTTPFFNILGGAFAIALGVGSFVGGLLGWLLVMKKRVLRCYVCGAIVNAS